MRRARAGAYVDSRRCRSSEHWKPGPSACRSLPMCPILTAFATSPDRGQGLARDMRVRWALEELGVAYDVQLLTFAEMKQPAHLARNPFGQIPTWQDGGQVLFESGAIVLHLAEQYPGLLPRTPDARMRAIMWMFAALNTVEPPIVERSMAWVLERGQPWYAQRLPMLDERVRTRLAQLSAALGDSAWLDGGFSAGDLMMVAVLLRLKSSGLLDEFPQVSDYVDRATQRPAYQRAFAAQRAVFQNG
ncbi:glutathione S-transferase [Stenotrophomonas maltophilia SKK35]|nr:glutathione S-transferase [Stenotrophomonas maltophilia SKK35]